MKKAIFTVLLGQYDTLKPPPKYPGWDAVLFTDHNYPSHKTRGWIVNKVSTDSPAKDSRKYKFLSHKYLPHHDLVCHIDASMVLKKQPPNEPMWFHHPRRNNVTVEAKRIIQLQKEAPQTIKAQLDFYAKEGFKDNTGLYQNGLFVRRHTPEQNAMCELVYKTLLAYSCRDQLSLPYAIWKTGVKPEGLTPGIDFLRWVTISPHTKRPQFTQQVKLSAGGTNVHHITPGRADKNLGLAVNSIISALPDQDWICLRDIDTMPPYHLPFFKQCEDIARESNFHLVGCITNRLGLKYQLHNGEFSENFDLKHHAGIGKQRFEQYGSTVENTKQSIAGLFMLFPKSTWLRVKGFPEGGIRINGSFVDWHFSEAVRNAGMRVGIAQGIYLVHNYRMWTEPSKNARRETKHLG